jgi:histidinol-phosphatase (PHP family)
MDFSDFSLFNRKFCDKSQNSTLQTPKGDHLSKIFAPFRCKNSQIRQTPRSLKQPQAVFMKFSSLHTHSIYCDGNGGIETLCAAAYQKGLTAIGFSSHAPIRVKPFSNSGWHLRHDSLDQYLDDVRAAKKRWAEKLKVFAGLEVDYIKDVTGPVSFKDAGLDYIIASVHYLVPQQGVPFTVDGSGEEFEKGVREGYMGSIEDAVNAYWDAEENMVNEGGFDILGHVDLIKKNNVNEKHFSPQSGWYVNRIIRLADRIAAAGITVEVNTGGLNRKKTTELYPSPFFLKLLRQRNVPVIITADAHCAEHLDGHYPQAVEALREAGYTEFRLDTEELTHITADGAI